MKLYGIIKKIIITLLALSMITISGCTGTSADTYRLYYTNIDGTRLTTSMYRAGSKGGKELVLELLNMLDNVKNSDQYISIKPAEVIINDVTLEGNICIIDFNNEYNNMNKVTEIFYRTAVIKTLSQIDGIENIDFTVDGETALDKSGRLLSNMNNSMYIDDNSTIVTETDWTVVALYFTNKEGDRLIRTQTNVAYNQNVSLESIVVAKLLAGPNETGLYPSLPENINTPSVSMRGTTCYVNFDETFLNNLVNAVGELPIYAVVNSLCELKTVNAVRILINGSSEYTYRELTDLDREFHFNDSYIENST